MKESVINKEGTLKFVPERLSSYYRVYMTPEHPLYYLVSRGTLGLPEGGYLTGGLVDSIDALDSDCWISSGVMVEHGSTVKLMSIIKKSGETSDLLSISNSKIFNSNVTCESGFIVNCNLAANMVNLSSVQSIHLHDSNFFSGFINIDGNSVDIKSSILSGNIGLIGNVMIDHSKLKGNITLQGSNRFRVSESVVLGNINFEGGVELIDKFIDRDGVLRFE